MLHFTAPLTLLADITFLLCLLFTPATSWDHWVNSYYGADDSKYCHLCPKGDHTLCKYKGIGPECRKDGVGPGGVTEAEKHEILHAHNMYRTRVAMGRERRGDPGPQPSAADMMKITWDVELARVAQRWADQCTFAHDSCRKDLRGPAGQNIYWKMRTMDHKINWTRAFEAFYDEVEMFDHAIVDHYRSDHRTGHYTQLVWANSHLVGCGRRDYERVKGHNIRGHYSSSPSNRPEDFVQKIYVCNYYPAGNWIGDKMYTKGSPCSQCPKGTRCLTGEALCSYTLSGSSYRSTTPTSHNTLYNKRGYPGQAQGPSISHRGTYGSGLGGLGGAIGGGIGGGLGGAVGSRFGGTHRDGYDNRYGSPHAPGSRNVYETGHGSGTGYGGRYGHGSGITEHPNRYVVTAHFFLTTRRRYYTTHKPTTRAKKTLGYFWNKWVGKALKGKKKAA